MPDAPPPTEPPDLVAYGERYKPAHAQVKALREELAVVVPIAILDHGVSEYAAARDTGIDRMAVRAWVKKERERRAKSAAAK